VAILLPVVLLLGGMEIALRLWGEDVTPPRDDHMVMRSDNPRLIYEYRPDHTVTLGGVEVRTNSAGFRDDEFVIPKPDGVFRIVILGDSLTFGYRVPVDDALPQQLERRLAGRDPAVEVFNLGVAGYNSAQEVELLKAKALHYRPDLLIVGYVLNDNREDADGGLSRYFTHSSLRIHEWLRIRVQRLRRKLGPDLTTEAFEELARVAAEANLPVVVVIFPELQLEEDGTYEKAPKHASVRGLCERLGFKVLDLLEPLTEAGFETIRVDQVHLNAGGYSIAAERLRAFLTDEGMIPPSK